MELKNIPDDAFIDNKRHFVMDDTITKPLALVPYNDHKWKKLFPSGDAVGAQMPSTKFKKLQLTEVGLYSIAAPDISQILIDFILEIISKHRELFGNRDISDLIVTETNGGIGGMSIGLLRVFNNLNIVELNPTHASIIKNNLDLYGYMKNPARQIKVLQNNYLDVMCDLHQDIIISDPPWGGKTFSNQKNIKLGFANIDITYVINFLKKHCAFKIFIFLAPFNFDFNSFMIGTSAKHVEVVKVRKHNYIAVFAE